MIDGTCEWAFNGLRLGQDCVKAKRALAQLGQWPVTPRRELASARMPTWVVRVARSTP